MVRTEAKIPRPEDFIGQPHVLKPLVRHILSRPLGDQKLADWIQLDTTQEQAPPHTQEQGDK